VEKSNANNKNEAVKISNQNKLLLKRQTIKIAE
jgi:hypothetical protein